MIEILFNVELNIYFVVNGMTGYEFTLESDAISKAEELGGPGNYFINPMIDVDARYNR